MQAHKRLQGGSPSLSSPRDGAVVEEQYRKALRRIRELEAQIAKMGNGSIETLAKENDTLKKEIQMRDVQFSDQKKMLDSAQKRTKTMLIKMESHEHEMKSLRDQNETISIQLESKDKDITKISKQCRETEQLLVDANNEVKRVVSLYTDMEQKFGAEIQRLLLRCSQLEQDAQEQMQGMKQRIVELQSENDSLRIAITECQAANSSIEEDREEYKCRNKVLNKKIDQLKEQMVASESESDQSARAQLEEVLEENRALQKKLDKFEEENADLERQIRALCASTATAHSDEASEVKEKIQMYLENDGEDIFRSPLRSRGALEAAQREIASLREENKRLKEGSYAEKENEVLRSKLADMTHVLQELTNGSLSGFGQSTILDNKTLIQAIADLKKENEALRQQTTADASEGESMSGIDPSLLNEVQRLQEENERLRAENEDLERSQAETDALIDKMKVLNSTLGAMSGVSGSSRGEEESEAVLEGSLSEGEVAKTDSEAREEIESLHNSFNLAEQFSRMRDENDALKEEIDKLKTENAELQRSYDEMVERNNSTIHSLDGTPRDGEEEDLLASNSLEEEEEIQLKPAQDLSDEDPGLYSDVEEEEEINANEEEL